MSYHLLREVIMECAFAAANCALDKVSHAYTEAMLPEGKYDLPESKAGAWLQHSK